MRLTTTLIESRLIIQSVVIALTLGYSGSPAVASTRGLHAEPNDLRWDLAGKFEFLWDSARSTIRVVNPDASGKMGSPVPLATLAVSVQLGILDTNNLLAVDVNDPVIFAVTDDNQSALQYQADPLDDTRKYHRVGMETFYAGNSRIDKLMPSGATVEVRFDPNHPMPTSVSLIKGYLYALFVDKIITVDIPYDPDRGWLTSETAPDLMFCMERTMPQAPGPLQYETLVPPSADRSGGVYRPKAIGLYAYMTWVRSKAGAPVMALEDVWYSPQVRASVQHVVVETQLVDSRHKRVSRSLTQHWLRSDAGKGASCQGSLTQDDNDYDTIRHIIGVHPVEAKIPFLLKNIPIPRN